MNDPLITYIWIIIRKERLASKLQSQLPWGVEVIDMEGTITKQSSSRSFLIGFEFLIWKEQLSVAASSEPSALYYA